MRDRQREAAKQGQPAKRRKKDENRVLNFTEEHLQDADYYIENGNVHVPASLCSTRSRV